jgi:hypothetical protein
MLICNVKIQVSNAQALYILLEKRNIKEFGTCFMSFQFAQEFCVSRFCFFFFTSFILGNIYNLIIGLYCNLFTCSELNPKCREIWSTYEDIIFISHVPWSYACKALKTKRNTPKYGLIFHYFFILRATMKTRPTFHNILLTKCPLWKYMKLICMWEMQVNFIHLELKVTDVELVDVQLVLLENKFCHTCTIQNCDMLKSILTIRWQSNFPNLYWKETCFLLNV